MASEQPARRRATTHYFPPCERFWLLHLRDGEPIGLVIDDKPYTVVPRRRGKGIRDGDQLVYVTQTMTAD